MGKPAGASFVHQTMGEPTGASFPAVRFVGGLSQVPRQKECRGFAQKPIGEGMLGLRPKHHLGEEKLGRCPKPHSGDFLKKVPRNPSKTFEKKKGMPHGERIPFFIRFFGVPRTFFREKVLGRVWGSAPQNSGAWGSAPTSTSLRAQRVAGSNRAPRRGGGR